MSKTTTREKELKRVVSIIKNSRKIIERSLKPCIEKGDVEAGLYYKGYIAAYDGLLDFLAPEKVKKDNKTITKKP